MDILSPIGGDSFGEPGLQEMKRCELNLEWEIFTVTFSVSHPMEEEEKGQIYLHGNHAETQNILMKKIPKKIDWMFVKFGEQA
jgi:hypothetical protein